MMDNIKKKLSSRKFWAAVVSFLTALLTAFNINNLTIEQVTLIVSGVGALAVYMLAEAHADNGRAKNSGAKSGGGSKTKGKSAYVQQSLCLPASAGWVSNKPSGRTRPAEA